MHLKIPTVMNKTIIINMNGIIFHIEEDAYEQLKNYMSEVKRHFAYTKDSVVCYTDLIKVSVALDNGKVVGFESQGYIMNHTDRTFPAIKVDENEAKKKVSPLLTILAHEMCIIPTSGKNEVYCHEFKCQNGSGNHYIVYVNAQTGAEEKILILLENASGQLTI